MKSIRLSLVVYFLVLLAAALGTVFTLVYGTAAAALNERRHGSQRLVEAQYQAQCQELRAGLDDRLRRQAQTVARAARPPLHFEGLYPLGVMGVPFVSAPH